MAGHQFANHIKLLPTYGVDNYGTDLFIPLGNDPTLSATSITLSTTTITHSTDGGNIPTDHQDEFMSDVDTVQLLNEGNDTAFDQTYRFRPDMSCIIYKTRILLPVGLNVSAYTNGGITVDPVTITITESGGNTNLLFQQTFPITIASLGATGSAYFIIDVDFDSIFKIYSGNPIDIRIEIPAGIETGTSTTQVGIVPVFCYQPVAVLKPFTVAGITFHVHASLDHADPIFNFDIKRVV